MKLAGIFMLGGIVALGCWASQAQALPQFKAAFQAKYVDNNPNQTFVDAFKKEGCAVCHVKGDNNKAHRNDYGKELAKITGGGVAKTLKAAKAAGGAPAQKAALAKALKTLDGAFIKVEGVKYPTGKTFGARIKAGNLP